MSFRGAMGGVREAGDRLIFRFHNLDSFVTEYSGGTVRLYLYELQSDGTLKIYDWADNSFKTGAPTTAYATMTQRNAGGSASCIYTYVLSTLTAFAAGGIYFYKITSSDIGGPTAMQEFQYGGQQPSGLTGNIDGNVTGSVGSIAAGGITAASIAADAITAAKIADGALDAATFAADCDVYRAAITLNRDSGAALDEWTIQFLKNNGESFGGPVTGPTMTLRARDNTTLFSAVALTQIGTTDCWKLDQAAPYRITLGETYLAEITATIGGSSRTFRRPIWRDA